MPRTEDDSCASRQCLAIVSSRGQPTPPLRGVNRIRSDRRDAKVFPIPNCLGVSEAILDSSRTTKHTSGQRSTTDLCMYGETACLETPNDMYTKNRTSHSASSPPADGPLLSRGGADEGRVEGRSRLAFLSSRESIFGSFVNNSPDCLVNLNALLMSCTCCSKVECATAELLIFSRISADSLRRVCFQFSLPTSRSSRSLLRPLLRPTGRRRELSNPS